ncbi:MAG: hypothetical protein ACRCU1_15205 [Alsobacter sp.]
MAAKRHGTGGGEAAVPLVTNEEAASILRVAMVKAKQAKLPDEFTSLWYRVALKLAGWSAPGDKFSVTPAHRKELLDVQATVMLWQLALGVAVELNNRNIPVSAAQINPSADYDAVLRQAWQRMQREDADAGAALDTPRPATSPSPATRPEVTMPAPSSTGLLVALVLLYAFTRKGRLI